MANIYLWKKGGKKEEIKIEDLWGLICVPETKSFFSCTGTIKNGDYGNMLIAKNVEGMNITKKTITFEGEKLDIDITSNE